MAEHARENPEDPNSRNSMMGVAKRALGLDQPNQAPPQPDAVDRAIEGALQRLSEGDVRLARQIADGMIPAIEAARRIGQNLDAFGGMAMSATPVLGVVSNGFEVITGRGAYDGHQLTTAERASAALGLATMGLSSTLVQSTVALSKAVSVARGIKAVQRVDQMVNVVNQGQAAVSDMGVLADSSASSAERVAAAVRLSMLGRSVSGQVRESAARAAEQGRQAAPRRPARPSNDNAAPPRPSNDNVRSGRRGEEVPQLPVGVRYPTAPTLSQDEHRAVIARMQRENPMPLPPVEIPITAANDNNAPALRARESAMVRGNRGLNASNIESDRFASIGSTGRTYVSDPRAYDVVLSRLQPGRQGVQTVRITRSEATHLEWSLGLRRGELGSLFKVRDIDGLSGRNLMRPTAGNALYLGYGQGLQGGGPEFVVDGISTRDGNGVRTLALVQVIED